MLTALFKLGCNTQKSTRTIFFKYQDKMFINIENALVSSCTTFFFHIFERCQIFNDLVLEKYRKTKLALNSTQNFKTMV